MEPVDFGGSEEEDWVFDEPVITEEQQKEMERLQKEREEKERLERRERDLVRRYCPTSGDMAARRLISDLMVLERCDAKDLGFSCEMVGNNIFSWRGKIFDFDPKTPIYQDMKRFERETGRNYIELSITFPPNYPVAPPFVRVVLPRFQFHTGRVTVGGSLCIDLLTASGWLASYQIDTILATIMVEIMSGQPRIDFSAGKTPYNLDQAVDAYRRVARDHGWSTTDWRPDH